MFKSFWAYLVHLFWKDEKKIVVAVSKELPVVSVHLQSGLSALVAAIEKAVPATTVFDVAAAKVVSDGISAIIAELEKLVASLKK